MQSESIHWIDSSLVSTTEQASELVSDSDQPWICFCLPTIWRQMDFNILLSELRHAHIVHSGLLFSTIDPLKDIQAVTLNWNFLFPDRKVPSYSWMATPHFVAFGREAYKQVGGFDPKFEWSCAVADFSYRLQRAGGVTKYVSWLEALPNEECFPSVSHRDVLRFASRHLGRYHARLLWMVFVARFRFVAFPETYAPPKAGENLNVMVLGTPHRNVTDYTAIIPTVLRYDYITRSIDSLLSNAYPPAEIIVVDQSPVALRQNKVYEPYIQKGVLRVFYLDEPGQSVSRNLAIRESKTEWLLFFEDDTEAWPELIREHRYLLEHSLADVSTGVSLAPWKDNSYIPEKLRKYHISDILATGNSFMRRDTAWSVGGLNLAFDRGPGADDDFGRRLFLSGKLIIYNFKAIQTHHKAPRGGMRVHGAWWRNTSAIFGAYPPPTQMFVIRCYYERRFWLSHILLFYLRTKSGGPLRVLLDFILLPIKLIRSWRESSRLLRRP